MGETKSLINRLVDSKVHPQESLGAPAETSISVPSEPSPAIANILTEMLEQPLYLLEIAIVVGTKQSMRFEPSDLGIHPELIEQLKAIEARGGYAPKFSRKLKQGAEQLRAAEKNLYQQSTVYSAPFRFIRQEHLPKALDAISEIEQLAAGLRIQLSSEYESELADFLNNVQSVLVIGLSGNDDSTCLEEALTRYADAYPSPQDFEEALQVVVKGPIQVRSITEQLQANQSLQAELARQDLEVEQLRQAQQEAETLRKSQELLAKNLGEAFYQVNNNCVNEAHGIVSELVDRLSVKDPNKFTNRDNDAWTKILERLQLLASHNPRLTPLSKWVETLYGLYSQSNPPPDHYSRVLEKVNEFKSFLVSQASESPSGSQGTEKLIRSLEFDQDFTRLSTELRYLQQHPDPTRLNELSGSFTSTVDQLKFRHRTLAKLYQQAKEAQTQAPTNESDAFDAEAEF